MLMRRCSCVRNHLVPNNGPTHAVESFDCGPVTELPSDGWILRFSLKLLLEFFKFLFLFQMNILIALPLDFVATLVAEKLVVENEVRMYSKHHISRPPLNRQVQVSKTVH